MRAANKGDTRGYLGLGEMFYKGSNTEKNYKIALKNFYVAAEKSDPDAQYYIGEMYYNSHGREKNVDEAVNWFIKSADQNNPSAISQLKILAKADNTKAREWLIKHLMIRYPECFSERK